ncbi:hypothetical protein [Dyella koreensis]|uniref:Flagellar protein FliT n=1 Tax=Dyella koreensis TaxID=311235 RepID=A0ABW8K5I8_9GAMM
MSRAPLATRLDHHVDRLRDVAASRDWLSAVKVDRELRALASELSSQAQWRIAEYRALGRARAELRATLDLIAVERQRLVSEMNDFNRHRSARMAYAMHDDAMEMVPR